MPAYNDENSLAAAIGLAYYSARKEQMRGEGKVYLKGGILWEYT